MNRTWGSPSGSRTTTSGVRLRKAMSRRLQFDEPQGLVEGHEQIWTGFDQSVGGGLQVGNWHSHATVVQHEVLSLHEAVALQPFQTPAAITALRTERSE